MKHASAVMWRRFQAAGMKKQDVLVGATFHIPYFNWIGFRYLPRRSAECDCEERCIDIMNCRFLSGFCFGGFDPRFSEMIRTLNCVSIHGGWVDWIPSLLIGAWYRILKCTYYIYWLTDCQFTRDQLVLWSDRTRFLHTVCFSGVRKRGSSLCFYVKIVQMDPPV